jgi:hypothetical protein
MQRPTDQTYQKGRVVGCYRKIYLLTFNYILTCNSTMLASFNAANLTAEKCLISLRNLLLIPLNDMCQFRQAICTLVLMILMLALRLKAEMSLTVCPLKL